MNHAAITKEALLSRAAQLAEEQGLEALSIRALASACGISVGCIYNYYPSKSELVLALMERFWRSVFHGAAGQPPEGTGFVEFVEVTYRRLREGMGRFDREFLRRSSDLAEEGRRAGRKLEADYWSHMRAGMVRVLEHDLQIRPGVWTPRLTPEKLTEFTFDHMLFALRRGDEDCGLLLQVLQAALYERENKNVSV